VRATERYAPRESNATPPHPNSPSPMPGEPVRGEGSQGEAGEGKGASRMAPDSSIVATIDVLPALDLLDCGLGFRLLRL
jgi:hypothetical protein